jgi:hypothetical protein
VTTKVKDIRSARKKRAAPAAEWQRDLILNTRGVPTKTLPNVLSILSQHPAWEGVLAYDQFGERVVKLRPPPTRAQAAAWLASVAGVDPAVSVVEAAVVAVAERTIIHPVRDWLSDLAWDGTPRLDSVLEKYVGAEPSKFVTAVGARWMISAVARVFAPGCPAHHMLVLEGPQGLGKSTWFRELAGGQWFADTGVTIGDKDSYQSLRGVWIYELAEMASIRGREVERIKAFLSSPSDHYRPSYGRATRDFPRQTVFAGTTNDDQYLSDPTGARRFWPVRCRHIDLEGLRRDREQLWAEATVRYRAGESWYLDTTDLQVQASEQQEERAEQDDWVPLVQKWLSAPSVPAGGPRDSRVPLDPSEGYTTGSRREWRYFLSPHALGWPIGDASGDTDAAENMPLSPVTSVTGTRIHTGEQGSAFSSALTKPAVTAVTAVTPDTYEADERTAIEGWS